MVKGLYAVVPKDPGTSAPGSQQPSDPEGTVQRNMKFI